MIEGLVLMFGMIFAVALGFYLWLFSKPGKRWLNSL